MSQQIKNNLRRTFNSRIIIKRKVKSIVNGRATTLEEDYFKCWCNPKELYGKELYEAINIKLKNVLSFEVRYCEKIKEMRNKLKDFSVVFENQIYDIFYIDFKNNSKDIVLIKCNEVT